MLAQHSARQTRRPSSARRPIPTVEICEDRLLLSSTGPLQGFVHVSGTSQPLPHATLLLENLNDPSFKVAATTDANGFYSFSTPSPGLYRITETPPPGYLNESTAPDSPLTRIVDQSASSIDVQVGDLSQLRVSYVSRNKKVLTLSNNGLVAQGFVGQDNIIVNEPNASDSTPLLATFCIDFYRNIFVGEADLPYEAESLATGLGADTRVKNPENAGRIAYLFNQFGSTWGTSPSTFVPVSQAAGFQLALWELQYEADDQIPYNVTDGTFLVKDLPASSPEVIWAQYYLASSEGRSEVALYLDGLPAPGRPEGSQSLIASGSLDFTNLPKFYTTPDAVDVTLGTTPPTLRDTAVLTAFDDPTGTITFSLYQGASLVHTEVVAVNGNGTYSTPAGYTPPANAPAAGSYQWNAIYSGDHQNLPAADINSPGERVVVSPAAPEFATTPKPKYAAIGGAPVTLNDTAVLDDAYFPTGTITFTLYQGSDLKYTEVVTVNGNGTYSTAGYALPDDPASAGVYQWNAVYSGDANNLRSSDENNLQERVYVATEVLTLVTTPTPKNVTLIDAPATLNDTAILTGGIAPTGTVTFTLYHEGILVHTEVASVNGPGNYSTTGYSLPTNVTAVGTYQWNATYSGDGSNPPASDLNNPDEQVFVHLASPTIVTTPIPNNVTLGGAPVTLGDRAVLDGGYFPRGTITFTLYQGSDLKYTEVVTVNGNGTYATSGYTLPDDPVSAGVYQWNAVYSGDANNLPISDLNNPNEWVVVHTTDLAIATVPTPKAVTLTDAPVTLTDTAFLTGGIAPTGTITFTLYHEGTLVHTEVVSVNGNGPYSTAGYTLPTSDAVIGTYQWNTVYSGDADNPPLDNLDNDDERVFVTIAAPSISTTPTPKAVLVGSAPVLMTDSAVLAGGYFPTGTIAFTLLHEGGLVHSEVVVVNGNGTYSTVGYALPANAETGIYQWNASYSGDPNNSPTSDANNLNEQVFVGIDAPTLSTMPAPKAVTLGDSPVILNDTAFLNDGSSPTGTISFTLLYEGILVHTEVVTVNGNGTYTTNGYTLPTSGAVVGNYQWNASYSGDANNLPADDIGNPDEQVFVSPANPTLSTTPTPTELLIGSAPILLTDTAVLAAGYYPAGTITFTLVREGSVVHTEVVAVNGNGIYSTVGYNLPANAPLGVYQWNASYSGDPNNLPASDLNSPDEQVEVKRAHTMMVTVPSPTSVVVGNASVVLTDTAFLTGGIGPTGTITFTLYAGANLLYTEVVAVNGNGAYTTTDYALPANAPVGTYQWNASYSGDALNFSSADVNSAGERVFVTKIQPAIITAPVPTSVTLDDAPVTLNDTAILTGGIAPTGTVTFTLYHEGTLVHTEVVSVNGNGPYSTAGYTLPTSAAVIGTYQWNAVYSGDADNPPAADIGNADEQVLATIAAPTLSTTPAATSVTLTDVPVTLNDTAFISGGYFPTGTISFTLLYEGSLVHTEVVSVNGNGPYSTVGYTLPTSGSVTGTYQWNAVYSGDDNNLPEDDIDNPAERVVVTIASPSIVTTPTPKVVTLGDSPVTLNDTAVLDGGYFPTGAITFTLLHEGSLVYTEVVTVGGNGPYTTSGYTLPTSGTVIGTYQWNAVYSGDDNNQTAGDIGNPDEQVLIPFESPLVVTSPTPKAVTLTDAPVTLNDTAFVSGGYFPTGTISFTLMHEGTLVHTEVVAVNGNGAHSTTGYTLPTSGTVIGTYQWNAVYSGDDNNSPTADIGNADEQVFVSPGNPTLSTTPVPKDVILSDLPVALNDTAFLNDGYFPTGTITFTLLHDGSLIHTEVVVVNGNGSYATSTGYTLQDDPASAGLYQWNAVYNGDPNNLQAKDIDNPSEQVNVPGTGDAFCVVNTLDDGSEGSLRWAIGKANRSLSADPQIICFDIPGPSVINILQPMPWLTRSVIIDGTTQRGYFGGNVVQINGNNLSFAGLTLGPGASGSTIKGLSITNFAAAGIQVLSSGNSIGDIAPGAGNQITGNTVGVAIEPGTSGNSVVGNRIGVSADGMTPLPNLVGVSIDGASLNTVGGSTTGAGNTISANRIAGIAITGGASSNTVAGNIVGGSGSPGNDVGVLIRGSSFNVIGGGPAGSRNVISRNRIGIQVEGMTGGSSAALNRAIGNEISDSSEAGISLLGIGVSGTQIQGNSILGNNPTSSGAIGIYVTSSSNTIGGIEPGSGNFIAGTRVGILFDNQGPGASGSSNLILGNRIGNSAAATGSNQNGIWVNEAARNTIGGTAAGAGNVIESYQGTGIYLVGSGASGTLIQGNSILNNNPTTTGPIGIRVGSSSNTIGGTAPGSGNLISGNSVGIQIDGSGSENPNLVQGNRIGNPSVVNEANLIGIWVNGASQTLIGGTATGAGNAIESFRETGIYIFGSGSSGTLVQGNSVIGGSFSPSSDPLAPEPVGVYIQDSSSSTIGGGGAGAANTIHANVGVYIFQSGGSVAANNRIVGNQIYASVSGPTAAYGVLLYNAPRNFSQSISSGNSFIGAFRFRRFFNFSGAVASRPRTDQPDTGTQSARQPARNPTRGVRRTAGRVASPRAVSVQAGPVPNGPGRKLRPRARH